MHGPRHDLDDVAPGVPSLGPHVIILLGATGDRARRTVLPGLLHLMRSGLLPDCRIVGVALGEMADAEFRTLVRRACDEFARSPVTALEWSDLSSRLTYASLSRSSSDLIARVREAEGVLGGLPARLHYLSIPPAAAPSVVRMLGDTGLSDRSRVILETPFGTDLATSRTLDALLADAFDDGQVFRTNHLLDGETAQGVLALRFAGGLFEPIWNRRHIDHVQIDVAESQTVEGRGGFYDGLGAFRDMVVPRLFHVLALMAMEPPAALTPERIAEETEKVFRSMRPLDVAHVVRGQYDGYGDEPGVADGSGTETLVALRCEIDNSRWAGVPFYLRTGKAMAMGARTMSVGFRELPSGMFPADAGIGPAGPGNLTVDLSEASRRPFPCVCGRRPDRGMRPTTRSMRSSVEEDEPHGEMLAACERLIYDVMRGDRTLFTSATAVGRLWEVSAPLLRDPPPALPYAVGSWGPDAVHELIAPWSWRLPARRGPGGLR